MGCLGEEQQRIKKQTPAALRLETSTINSSQGSIPPGLAAHLWCLAGLPGGMQGLERVVVLSRALDDSSLYIYIHTHLKSPSRYTYI